MFLDDTPAYPAAFFGAVRAGFVPLLINTLTPSDLLQFYLSDSGASVAVADAEFCTRFDATACKDTPLRTLIVVNGAAGDHAAPDTIIAEQWLGAFATDLAEADTDRNEMAFWMYSSGSTGRPKGIVHLQHDMAYSDLAFARNVLKLMPDDICFSVPKMFFAYGFGNSITFPFSAGAATLLLPGQPKPAAIFEAIGRFHPTVFFGLPTLYTSLTKAEGAVRQISPRCAWRYRRRRCFRPKSSMAGRNSPASRSSKGWAPRKCCTSISPTCPSRKNSAPPGCACPATKSRSGTRTAARSPTTKKAFCGCAAIPQRRCTGTGLTNQPRPSATEGWIYTGDRFVRDSDGFYFFRGRADDLIKISGQWVYPLEVELCLAEHPEVRECAVFATELPDRRMTLKAVVVMNSCAFDANDATKMLQDFVKAKLLPYKYPREIKFIDELPKTGTGKIDRQAVLRM